MVYSFHSPLVTIQEGWSPLNKRNGQQKELMSLCVAQVTPQGLFTGIILLLATTWPPQATKARWWRAPAVTIFLPLAQGKKT